MISKKINILLFLILFLFPTYYIFAQVPNVGFIPANIWYSKDPFEEGDKIKIYTLVYNPDDRELSGTVIFFDNTVFLGKKDFKAPAKSVKDIFIDWTVTSGDHVIFAKIENARFLISKDKYEDVYLAENKTAESKKNVSRKIITELPNNIVDSISNSTSISNIQKIVKDNTPVFVSSAIDTTVNSLEKIRTSTSVSVENKKKDTQKEIEILNKSVVTEEKDMLLDGEKGKTIKDKLKNPENTNNILKPFKYLELFFLTIFSYIFKYQFIFYILLVVIFLLIIRFIWGLIF